MWLLIITVLTVIGLTTVISYVIHFAYSMIGYFIQPVVPNPEALNRLASILEER